MAALLFLAMQSTSAESDAIRNMREEGKGCFGEAAKWRERVEVLRHGNGRGRRGGTPQISCPSSRSNLRDKLLYFAISPPCFKNSDLLKYFLRYISAPAKNTVRGNLN